MPVNTPNSEYNAHIKSWTKSRDAVNGSDAVKKRGPKYLPQLDSQSTAEYDAYVSRALYFGASGRTVQGLLGAVFRKDYELEYPERYKEEHMNVFTPEGLAFRDYAKQTVDEVITVGRVGCLVDVYKEGDPRAYATLYSAEKIINWETTLVEGRQKLTLVILEEQHLIRDPNDEFHMKRSTQYRVLRMVDGVYTVDIYRKKSEAGGTGEAYVRVPNETVTPARGGVKLDFIPFIFINADDLTASIGKPPLLDLVEVNLSHYRTSADLEHGAHYTALPTAWVAGFNTDAELRIGSRTAWISNNPQATAGFLEFKGQGLGALSGLKADKERQMAVLGARLLEESKKAVEATGTHEIRLSGEHSALSTIAQSCSDGLQQILKWVSWWSGASEEQVAGVEFALNNDFLPARMSPQELMALMQAWQQGGISQDTFLHNLKRGEILPEDTSVEEEKDRLDFEGDQEDDINAFTPVPREFNVERGADGKVTSIREG